MEPTDLKAIRNSLDSVDRRIVEMLAARQQIINRVASLKAEGTQLPRDPLREEEILVRNARGLNLTKLESRPRRNNPWEYLFYVDFEGNLSDPVVEEVLAELTPRTSYLKVHGSYPARTESRREQREQRQD